MGKARTVFLGPNSKRHLWGMSALGAALGVGVLVIVRPAPGSRPRAPGAVGFTDAAGGTPLPKLSRFPSIVTVAAFVGAGAPATSAATMLHVPSSRGACINGDFSPSRWRSKPTR